MKTPFFSTVVILLTGLAVSLTLTGCRSTHTAYFGVEDRAMTAPKEFKQTQAAIERAKETADSPYARKKIDEAMTLGREAAITYWACYDQEAKDLLAQASLAAYEAELFHPQAPPPASARTADAYQTPDPPGSLNPGPPFAALKALPPRMILEKVHFAFDSFALEPPEKQILDDNSPLLTRHADIGYEIAGHTDIIGTDDHNKELSEKRAEIVLYYLASRGVPPRQMFPVGYGKHEILDPRPIDEIQARNRRTEVRVHASASLVPLAAPGNIDDLPKGTPIEVVGFNYADHQLLPIQQMVLDQTVTLLKAHPDVSLEIGGHAYAEGGPDQMAALSQRRINSVRDYLVANGISAGRIQTRAYADAQPILEEIAVESPDNRVRRWSRRVEIRIAGK